MSEQRLIDANALKEQIDYYIKEAGWSEHFVNLTPPDADKEHWARLPS